MRLAADERAATLVRGRDDPVGHDVGAQAARPTSEDDLRDPAESLKVLREQRQRSILDAHYPSARLAVSARAIRPKAAKEKAFSALGPASEAFLTGAAASGAALYADPAELMDHGHAHGLEALLKALSWTRALGRWGAEDVRSILPPVTPSTPRPAGDVLVVALPAVAIRSTADYAILPSGEVS